ncbi:hypothetical protein [Paenibacillus crassostreae]|nr:hypothetical protein [Paenibacillus crassostreae]
MKGNKEVRNEARLNLGIPEKVDLDIIKIMEQCSIQTDKWKEYIRVEQK